MSFLWILNKKESVDKLLKTFDDNPTIWHISKQNKLLLDEYGSPYYFDNIPLSLSLIKSWSTSQKKKKQMKLLSLGADQKSNSADDVVYIVNVSKRTVRLENDMEEREEAN